MAFGPSWPLDNPIISFFGADNCTWTKDGLYPYLKRIYDPISAKEPCNNDNWIPNGGMGSAGASRWGYGNTSQYGNGQKWSVKWDRPEQILIHYYTGIQLWDVNNIYYLPPYRWNPLNIDWGTSNNTPPLMYHGNSYPITLDAQNTGEFDWWLLDDWALSYRWSKTGFSEIRSNNRAWTSSYVSKGSNYTFNPTINDIPDWGAGTYTLKFDMIRGLSGGESWFGDPPNAWETYNVTICVDEPCNVIEGKKTFLPIIFKSP